MNLNNIILIFLLIGIGLFFYKYFLLIINKYGFKLLIDDEFKKPQAFHEFPVTVSGGLGIFFFIICRLFKFYINKKYNFFGIFILLYIFFSPWFYR